MKQKPSLLLLVAASLLLINSMLLPAFPAQSPSQMQPFDPVIARIRDGLSLTEEQTAGLRSIFARHALKLLELRNRGFSQPYAPQLQAEIEKERDAIRQELIAILTDVQKEKLSQIDMRPLPQPPPYIPVAILPQSRPGTGSVGQPPLALTEPAIPAVQTGARQGRLTADQRILQLLNRATFGPRPGDLERIRNMGIDKFLDQQLHPSTIDDSDVERRLAALPTQQMSSAEICQYYPPLSVADERMKDKSPQAVFGRPLQILVELEQQKLVRAVSSDRQLQEVMTDFWFNHFNVFFYKDADQWFLPAYERDVIRPRALGKFRDLLGAVAQSPAMLYYLDNWLSTAPDSHLPHPPVLRQPAKALAAISRASTPPQPASRRPGINENYARELMELHTLGVNGGYTQRDVQEVARCFTGWTIDKPGQGGPFAYRGWMHDNTAKKVLGASIPAGGGISDGYRVLDLLAEHPSTASFISRKLCQRFVSDNPSPGLVRRIAQVFLRTDGDIAEVLKAIFSSPEFNSPAAFRSKTKSPLELVASSIRAVDGDTDGAPALQEWLRKMGEPLYQYLAPTGYGEDSSMWVNTGLFLNRLNFAVALAGNQIKGTGYDAAGLLPLDAAADPGLLIDRLAALIVHTPLSVESRRAVEAAIHAPQPGSLYTQSKSRATAVPVRLDPAATRRSIGEAVGLMLGTAEFQKK